MRLVNMRARSDPRPWYIPEYSVKYSQSSTRRTFRSVSREQVDNDLASANMALKSSNQGILTEEQKEKEIYVAHYSVNLVLLRSNSEKFVLLQVLRLLTK